MVLVALPALPSAVGREILAVVSMAVLASANHPRAIVALVIDWVAHGVRLPGASSVACMYGRGVLEDSVQDPARPGATIRIVIAEVHVFVPEYQAFRDAC